MGKSKKKRRRSSSSDSDGSNSKKELRKRLEKLESLYNKRAKRSSRSRSRSRSRADRRDRSRRSASPTFTSCSLGEFSQYRRSSARSVYSMANNSNFDNNSGARDPSDLANTVGSIAHSPCGTAVLDTDELIIHNDVDLSEDVLNILGTDPSPKNTEVFQLHTALSARWSHIITKGLPENEYNNIIQKYGIPLNCPLLSAPTNNPEAKAIIPPNIQKKDEAYVQFQSKLGHALAALGKGIDSILKETENMPVSYKDKLLPYLSDSGRLLSSLFHDLSMARRSFIFPYMNKHTKELLEQCFPSDLLFGPEIMEKVKAAKTLELASKDMKPPTLTGVGFKAPSRNLSFRGGKKGGGQDRGQPYHNNRQNLNKYRPARQSRETGSYRGQTSKDVTRDRYKRRK